MNPNEKLVNDLNQGRLANLGADVLFPILTKHRDELVQRMCARFRDGEKDLIAEIAQISYIEDLLAEIQNVSKRGERAFNKLNNNGKP